MRRTIWALLALALLILGFLLHNRPAAATTGGEVVVLRIDGVIGPATSDFFARELRRAHARQAALLVLAMDTPGGLDTSMRAIIKDILAAPLPIVTWVGPEGARAASAGTYILYASHVAAMAPATNLGAATPVAIGMPGGKPGDDTTRKDKADDNTKERDGNSAGDAAGIGDSMMEKVRNDAAAYLRSLAQLRGRSGDFAERAVREAASLSSEEALAAGVIDLIAADLPELMKKLDGREVKLGDGRTQRLSTAAATVTQIAPDWRMRLLALLSNPQLALVLMMIGIYALFFEFTSPGFGVPGVAGAICLLVALYAFQLLPVNWAGVALLALGAILMLAEAFLPSFGALGVGGIVAFVVGGLFLMDTEAPGFGIPLAFLIGLAIASALVIGAVGSFAARTRRRPIVSGREQMAGTIATVTTVTAEGAWALAQGESWRVRSASPLAPGDRVRITGLDGLTLLVEPLTADPANRRGGSPP
ncbi:NfeD family protein [Aromatoleum evansii]|uniref:Nodulation protein NfeD n=1 Tax=Aromatoleum evansii TaxID=59406 RepID=A0ABZ1AJQ4_AROEV|nr:nodulation protein NfeD [Aromatoleum evansii]NMG31395.1 nodulation protein NfeD [Aromatoleum evansii]WRL46097.1 nodulation protein NfeD [Aromatoleum evansii]